MSWLHRLLGYCPANHDRWEFDADGNATAVYYAGCVRILHHFGKHRDRWGERW